MADVIDVKEKKKRKSSLKTPSKASSRKSSSAAVTNGTGDDVSEIEEVDEVQEEQPVKQELADPEPRPVQPSEYVVPPAATKRDISLLSDIDDTKLLELHEAFILFDLNQDGIIDKQDLINTYRSLGQINVPEEEIQHMLAEAPGPLDFDAFVILLGYKTIELDPEETLVEALSQWDYDNSGLIAEDRIRHDLMTWGDRFSPKEVDVALEDAPVYINKGKAMIDYIKFCKALCGLRKKPKVSPSEQL